ncbi:MAG: HAMP domain-containing sensor histidine kinase [Sphaerochaetaceae bacterium]|nr:HAMP domain-containing sensor histidine kinase [Sphaerochaetaceae bacterium]
MRRSLKKNRMKSLFSRLFASIMAITILILVLQIIVVAIVLNFQSQRFSQDVFETYEQRLNDLLSSELRTEDELWTLEELGPVLRAVSDDRISGLIVHDEAGDVVISMGKTPRGFTVGDFAPMQDSTGRPPVAEQEWNIRSISNSEETMLNEKPPESPIRPRDIARTINLYGDSDQNEYLGYVDVMVLNPLYYEMTSIVLRNMMIGFGITVIFALVIAFFGSHTIARSVSRHAVKIVNLLGNIARGRYDDISYQSSVSELKQIGDSVETLKRKLAGHERMRQQWLQGIAHDLNTPLTSLKLAIESALDEVVPLDRSLLERMQSEHDELEKRVASVMMLASMESPDFRIKHASINVLDFVDEVVTTSLSDHKVVLDIQTEQITGSRQLLVLVARELISNGCKYSPKGTLIKWTLDYDEQEKENVMIFSNTGKITGEALDRAFEPWFRSDTSRSKSGSGMGLAIVRQVIQSHDGDAVMERDGKSVIITLRWPKV